jgi:hypothetical protein
MPSSLCTRPSSWKKGMSFNRSLTKKWGQINITCPHFIASDSGIFLDGDYFLDLGHILL